MRAWLWAWLFYARPASASFVPSDPLPFLYSSVSFQSCVFFDHLPEPVPGKTDGQLGVIAVAFPPDNHTLAILRVHHRRSLLSRGLRFGGRRRPRADAWGYRAACFDPAFGKELRDVLQIIRLSGVGSLRDGFADRMLFGAQIHLPRHILLAVACDKMRWNLGQKSRGLGGFLRTSTEAAAPSRPAQEQAFLGARHPYVAEPAFFLHQGRRLERPAMWKQ